MYALIGLYDFLKKSIKMQIKLCNQIKELNLLSIYNPHKNCIYSFFHFFKKLCNLLGLMLFKFKKINNDFLIMKNRANRLIITINNSKVPKNRQNYRGLSSDTCFWLLNVPK